MSLSIKGNQHAKRSNGSVPVRLQLTDMVGRCLIRFRFHSFRKAQSLLILFTILGLAVTNPYAEAAPSLNNPPAKPGWVLTFNDEFDNPNLDTTKWETHYWWGRTNAGNQELEYYADDANQITNGVLRLRADKRQMEGFAYTSGMISSHNSFAQKYGYFEMRAKMPAGKGLWPAFWLLPGLDTGLTWPPEIDVVEFLGNNHRTVNMNYHYANDKTDHAALTPPPFTGPDFTADFHVFAVEWAASGITWYVDGVQRARTDMETPSVPMYLLATFAVGGWATSPSTATLFPSYWEIDFIRAYQKTELRPLAQPGTGLPQFTCGFVDRTSTPFYSILRWFFRAFCFHL